MLIFLFNRKSFSRVETDVQPITFGQLHAIRKAHLLKPKEVKNYSYGLNARQNCMTHLFY